MTARPPARLRRPLLAAALVLCPALAAAQAPGAEPPPDRGVAFLSRFAFAVGAERIASDDPRFTWDANYGGEVDLVDYGAGRMTFYANYQVVLGDELRAFDPNQGNYVLGARLSARIGGTEAALVFHHLSRHLSDREKVDPVDWNMLGGRLSRSFTAGRVAVDAAAGVRGVVQRSFVDYEWELEAGARARYPSAGRVALVGEGFVRRLAVDGEAGRGDQTGLRGEVGLRLEGRGAAVEFYVAAERRVDPYPLALGTERWVAAGFRLVGE